MKISPHHFVELTKKSYTLDHIYILTLINDSIDIEPMCKESMKIEALHVGLIRKGLITDDNKLTTLGKEILDFLDTKTELKLPKKKNITPEFEEWWKQFPGTDTFVHKGKNFKGSRSLRTSKEDCKTKFNKILLEGEYTANEMIEALKFDVNQKKDASVSSNTNKLTYLQNSLTYLNQRSFEPFIELIQQGIKFEEKSSNNNTTDI